MTRPRIHLIAITGIALATFGLAACGSSDDGAATPSTSPAVPSAPSTTLRPATPTTVPPTTPTVPPTVPPTVAPTTAPANGGGGMQAGAPQFESFTVSSPVQCQDGNATAQMSFSTINVVTIEIKIGDGKFESTAGYGPNESDVVASIPCSGAGQSSIQLRGCTESQDCVDSEQQAVEITA